MRIFHSVVRFTGFTLVLLFVVSCGGGGGSPGSGGGNSTGNVSLKGTAAAGAPIVGTVTVKGSLGNTRSALIEANGSYDVDVTGLTPPFRLRAQGSVGGRTYKLHSYAETADAGGNVNITPFTDLIVANAARQVAESYFDSTTPTGLDPAELDAQETALQAKLQDIFTVLGVETAINLLNSTFSADHSGLDAALDIVRIEVDSTLQLATITNLVDNASIIDSVTDPGDNSDTLPVDAGAVTTAVTDIQAIAAQFDALTAAFAGGLPTQASIEDILSTDFHDADEPRGLWLTEITTDPGLIDLGFSSVVVSDLDSIAGTATVAFHVGLNGVVDVEPNFWLFARDVTLGWQARGNQRIVDTYFAFHCNDNDGNSPGPAGCGVNTRFWDEDFSNNGTGDAAIASGTVSIINGSDGVTVRDVIYLGTPDFAPPGDVQVYNEVTQQYQGDYRGFGTGGGEIDPAIFVAGDIIQYDTYTQPLDITNPFMPAVATGTEVATYQDRLMYAPSLTTLYPDATPATVVAMENFTQGSDLTIAWTLAAGTRNNEVLAAISDDLGNRVEIWDDIFGSTSQNVTFASTLLDSTASSGAGLDANAESYNLLVRIYSEDEITGQEHSRDYHANIPGPAAPPPPPPAGLACHFSSGWDDDADGGLGAPIMAKSFADFEESLATCATDGTPAQSFTAADVAGNSFVEDGETTTFNALGGAAGTEADRGSGLYVDGSDSIVFNWYVEPATCSGCTHSYIVLFSDSDVDPIGVPDGLSFRDTTTLTEIVGTPGVSGALYSFHRYSEQSNFSTDGLLRDTGSDGEIWNSDSTLQ